MTHRQDRKPLKTPFAHPIAPVTTFLVMEDKLYTAEFRSTLAAQEVFVLVVSDLCQMYLTFILCFYHVSAQNQ